MPRRKTIAQSVSRTAPGVQSGLAIGLALHPAEPETGLQLRRTDVGKHWPVGPQSAAAGPVSTIVGDDDHHVAFIEHLLGALAAAGITDALIEVSGPEIPLFEGGAVALWQMILAAGVQELDSNIAPLVLSEPVILSTTDCFISVIPSEATAYYYLFASDHPLIGYQWASFVPSRDDFGAEIAPARTFIAFEQARAAQLAGKLPGGSEDNAIVIYPDRLSATPTLSQAFARHKLLDMMGDLYLLGRPIQAHIIGSRSGHQQNHQLVQRLAETTQYEGNPALR